MQVKVGDKLRYVDVESYGLTPGNIYEIIDVEKYGEFQAVFIDDDGDHYCVDEEAIRINFEVVKAEPHGPDDYMAELAEMYMGAEVEDPGELAFIASKQAVENVQSPQVDNVQSPSHYTKGRTEVIDVIEDAVQGAAPFEAVCQANVLKYVLRYRHKNGAEDLRKAAWYLERLIAEKDA